LRQWNGSNAALSEAQWPQHCHTMERLRCLGLPSLELRRLYTDLIWCYKIVFGLVDLQLDDFFELSPNTHTLEVTGIN